MIAAGKLPHALLFSGDAGVGKGTTARALALALNCEAKPGEGCGTCGPCAKIAGGTHPDVHVIAPEGAGNQITIDPIRALAQVMGFAPHEGRARVVILEDAHRLNIQAANAFLKTLEEPPARTYFVLVTSAPEQLLVTIRSRCQKVLFGALPPDELAAILARAGATPERARIAALLSGGSVTRATELLDGDVLDRRRKIVGLIVRAAHAPGWKAAIDTASELAASKEDIVATLEMLALWYRDAAAVAAGARDRVVFTDELADLEAEAQKVRPAALARRAASVLEAQQFLAGYANPQLSLERMIMTLREHV
jgi:DNA polymerase-3 subunit delta'